MHRILYFIFGAGLFVLSLIWARSAVRLFRSQAKIIAKLGLENVAAFRRTELSKQRWAPALLPKFTFIKSFFLSLFAFALALSATLDGLLSQDNRVWTLLVPGVVMILSLVYLWPNSLESRTIELRSALEERAEEVLSQNELAPQRWASRLAPEDLVEIDGFEIAHYYQAGDGAMAGDFYDFYKVSSSRMAAAIGDVTGHGLDPAITAFQVKNLLRVFLKQYRDPAQVLCELNSAIFSQVQTADRLEEMVSVCLVVFDQAAGALRFASAGHPPAWLFHAGIVRPLRSTGPILALDPNADYFSREIPMEEGDVLLLYTDGLVEVRAGDEMFGEDRVANILSKDPRQPVGSLCSSLVNSAREFATQPFVDDVAVLAIKCSR